MNEKYLIKQIKHVDCIREHATKQLLADGASRA